MLDWLRYFPLALRHSNQPTVPRGPYFPWLLQHEWQFADTFFSLKCPASNSIYGDSGWKASPLSPARGDILQHSYNNSQLALMQTDGRWHHEHFFSRTWFFVGPWFSGYKSSLGFTASIVNPWKPSMFNESSFFHPRVFENAVADYLNSYFGHEKTGGKPHYRGPLNWKVLDISSTIKAALMDIHVIGNTSREKPDLKRRVFFPISDTQIVCLSFEFGGVSIYKKEPIDPAPVLELFDKIIDTFKLEVGPKTLADWNTVKASCPDMSITQEFGELKWPLEKKDIGKAQPLTEEFSPLIDLPESQKIKLAKD